MVSVLKMIQTVAVFLATWLTLWDYAPDWVRDTIWQAAAWAEWAVRLMADWIGLVF